MLLDIRAQIGPRTRAKALTGCLAVTILIALLQRYLVPDIPLGTLYIVPLLISALYLARWQVIVCAVIATYLSRFSTPASWKNSTPETVATTLLAFVSASLFVAEMLRRRELEAESLKRIKFEATLRQDVEQEERILIQKSPAAIVTVNPDGRIGLANDAARKLFGFGSNPLEGELIGSYLPVVAEVLKSGRASFVPSVVEGRGCCRNGDMFLVQMWLSRYQTSAGTKLAVVFTDISDELRDREESGLSQLLLNSRIIVGAISHEIRNLAAAAAVLHDNMGKSSGTDNKDFQALGRILEALRKLSLADMPESHVNILNGTELDRLLGELRVILEPDFREGGVELHWEILDRLPRVRADHSGLLQVFLNLAQNALQALRRHPGAKLAIQAYQVGPSVLIRFSDNGPGIAYPDSLFQPFQESATSTGLGLYVSRAIVRTYGGELQYIRKSYESAFVVELPAISESGAQI